MSTGTAAEPDAPPLRVQLPFRRLGWGTAASPVCLLLLQLLHALHLRLLLGRWPRVYRDNPDNYFLRIHDAALHLLFIATVCSVTFWVALSLIGPLLLPSAHGTILRQAGLMALRVLSPVLVWNLDPTAYILWLAD
jgi:hypothetical protein